ncbi:MAG: DUF4870 domain-containing protein [Rhizobiaceae bacterium]|nr:DUF4870 domain-containing protein [Rhizobiaceae bacterium]MCV0406131.1 DUF4870 domain-containing protein [Rhizobiaceae bacterium]
MTNDVPQPAPGRTDNWLDPGKTNVMVVYILYLVGFAVAFTPLVGLVIAYLNRGKAGGWVDTHYTYAIRTFWIGLLYALVAGILMIALIGFVIMVAVAVWVVVRCVIGLQKASNQEPIADPESWLI